MSADYPSMTTAEIRSKFLNFFEERGLKLYPSSSLVPDDPSLLLANAGMNQFKEYYQGKKTMKEIGAISCQKCVRTNDIDCIGEDGRHLSFFEMLGDFSFGGVSKQQACAWAFELITKEFKLPLDRLYFTVFTEDDETHDVWRSLGVAEDHISRLGEDDNFWAAGPTGPCGPCSEIYFDMGEEVGCGSPDCKPGCDCDRFLEFWNLVFTQYDRQEDGSMPELPHRNLDTGMGLERMAAIMQHKTANYDGDLMQHLIKLGEKISGKTYDADDYSGASRSLRIIADHSRAVDFMISDGILPGNEGREYVLRRLLRRAVFHGRLLGIEGAFLTKFIDEVNAQMGEAYPELLKNVALVKGIVASEEERFSTTLDNGRIYLDEALAALADGAVLPGDVAFKLHDTFGFPIDLTVEIAGAAGHDVDMDGFTACMEDQKARARANAKGDAWGSFNDVWVELSDKVAATEFDGYDNDVIEDAKVVAIVRNGESVESAAAGEDVEVVLDRTPFYAEMGGQVADHGYLVSGDAKLKVTQVKKTPKGYFVHTCELLDGTIHVDDEVTASVDEKRRAAICRNHTATHLLQKALREVLGEHVHQAGSYQDDQITHFDFTHFSAVSPAELAEVERRVNEKIYEALPVTVKNLPIEEAKKMGAMALFGEKYGSVVRVVDAGGWSTEFCGGTHVTNTAQIGCFKILSESSVAAGIRRIEATTAFGVLDLLDDRTEILAKTAVALKANNLKDAPARAEALAAELKETAKQLEILKAQMAAAKIDGLFENAADIDGVRIVSAYLTGTGADTLRDMVDKVRDKAPNAVTVLIGSDGNKTMMAVGVSKNALARGLKAGALVKKIAAIAGGNGGGKPDFAMAGIRDTSKIDDALNAVPEIVKAEMNQ